MYALSRLVEELDYRVSLERLRETLLIEEGNGFFGVLYLHVNMNHDRCSRVIHLYTFVIVARRLMINW